MSTTDDARTNKTAAVLLAHAELLLIQHLPPEDRHSGHPLGALLVEIINHRTPGQVSPDALRIAQETHGCHEQ